MGADPSSKLDRFEKALRERLAGAEAAAFLGHHPCPPQAKELLQAQLGRGVFAKSLRILFWKWPALTACWIAAHVRDRYGERDDHEFWPILNELFGHEIRAGERKSVAKLFQWACAKLDLARAVAGKHVDQFVVQAGAPVHQLDRFVRSCLELERAEGLPDPDDDPACLHFALAVAERLKPTNPRLARVLEADATAWYVRRWILLRSGSDDPADPDFVAELRDRSERVPERTSPFANPSLLWAEGGLTVRLPPLSEGRIRLEIGDRSLQLVGPREEERVSLAELGFGRGEASELAWTIDTRRGPRAGTLPLLKADGSELLLFALPGGRLLARVTFACPPGRCELPAGPLLAVAAGRFMGPDGPAEPWDSRLYLSELVLAREPIALERGALAVELVASERPRIDPLDPPAFVALGGEAVWAGPHLRVRVEHPPSGAAGHYELRVEADAEEKGRLQLRFEHGRADIGLEPILRTLSAGLLRARLAVVRAGERRALARTTLLVWNRLEAVEGGRFRCMPPTNLEPGASRHVLVAADGVALRRDQRYAEARLVFALETERIELRLPAPDPVAWVERRDPDGRPVTHLLDPAEPVVVQPGDPRILEIRCCEPEAELRFGNSRVRRPFRARPAYRCALLAAAEHCRSGDPTIAVRLPSGNELPLARLTVATEALAWRSLREPNDPPVEVLAFRLREPIETLWLYAEELIEGTRVELVLAPDGLDRTDPATGLEARLRQELGSPSFAYRLELPSRAWPGGPWLCRFEVGEDGSGDLGRTRRALSNARGDAFGWLIAPASASEREKRALDLAIGRAVTLFTRAHRALMRCWALPAWQDAGLAGLEHWWRGAARVIGSHPNREALIAALLPLAFEDPPADAAPSWIPILGLWHVFPDHWALPATYFSELEKSPEPAARRLARAAEPVRAGGLARALAGGLAIDQHHLGCFANLARASARLGDEELAGFDLTAWQGQLREARGTIGCEESAPLLAHAEFGAALEACRRRYDLVVASGGFEQHRPTAMTVVAAARRWLKREGSAFLRAAVPQLRGEFRGEFDLEEESGEALLAGLPWASLAVALACRLEPRRRGTLEKLFAALAEQAADRGRVFDGLQFVWDLARELFAFWLSFCEVLLVTGDHRA